MEKGIYPVAIIALVSLQTRLTKTAGAPPVSMLSLQFGPAENTVTGSDTFTGGDVERGPGETQTMSGTMVDDENRYKELWLMSGHEHHGDNEATISR